METAIAITVIDPTARIRIALWFSVIISFLSSRLSDLIQRARALELSKSKEKSKKTKNVVSKTARWSLRDIDSYE